MQETALQLAAQLRTQVRYDSAGMPPMEKGETVKIYMERVVDLKVSENADHLLNKLLELADGVFMVDKYQEGRELVYYKDKPDLKALEYLLDRVMGKPKETIEHEDSKKKEGLMLMEEIVKELADGGKITTKRIATKIPVREDEYIRPSEVSI